MRIVQLIDSLEAGGAERMAVNYANVLVDNISFSALVATRSEGILKEQLSSKVHYLYLNKKSSLDFLAVRKLKKFIISNQIQIIHAHSSSFFLAVLVKLTLPGIKIIWHDHYGNSEFLARRPKFVLQCTSILFNGFIAVNEKLKVWTLNNLHCKNGIYLPNFTTIDTAAKTTIQLHGQDGKRIVCLANLRKQKNHFFLLEVASKLKKTNPDWSFHLIGKDFQDDYSNRLKRAIKEQKLETNVYLYDSIADVVGVLNQVQIGILTSDSEGLPIAVLEYALTNKAVIVTEVGELNTVIKDGENGFLIPVKDVDLFHQQLVNLINNTMLRGHFAKNLHQHIVAQFSAHSIIKKYISWLTTTIKHE